MYTLFGREEKITDGWLTAVWVEDQSMLPIIMPGREDNIVGYVARRNGAVTISDVKSVLKDIRRNTRYMCVLRNGVGTIILN